MTWGSTDTESCYLVFSGNGVTLSIGDNDGFMIYNLTEPKILDDLVNYIQEKGILN